MAKNPGRSKRISTVQGKTATVNLAHFEAALDRIQLHLDDVRAWVAAMRKKVEAAGTPYPSAACSKKPVARWALRNPRHAIARLHRPHSHHLRPLDGEGPEGPRRASAESDFHVSHASEVQTAHALRSLTVILCSDCTLRCDYCYQRAGGSMVMRWPALRASLGLLARVAAAARVGRALRRRAAPGDAADSACGRIS